MNEKDKKLYVDYNGVMLVIIYFAILAAVIVGLVAYFESLWVWISFILFVVWLNVSAIVATKKGYLKPLYINSKRIKKGTKEYLWEDVRITLHYHGGRPSPVYYILFGTEYAFSEKVIKEIYKTSFCTLLKKESLETVLKYCKHKIKIVNYLGEEQETLVDKKKFQTLIEEFNAKHD
ncbi:MAG: hypothetical protein ACI4QL_05610 [Candidatus Fimimonas sp.]